MSQCFGDGRKLGIYTIMTLPLSIDMGTVLCNPLLKVF